MAVRSLLFYCLVLQLSDVDGLVLTAAAQDRRLFVVDDAQDHDRGHVSAAVDTPMPDVPPLDSFTRHPERLNFLRISKSGSSSFKEMFAECHEKSENCRNVAIHFHNVLARDLAPESKSFVILREPVGRFVSQWAHLKVHLWQCTDIGIVTKDFLNDTLATPISWGQRLLKDKKAHAAFMARDPANFHKECAHSLIAWPQSDYVNENTQVACLPSMTSDIREIFDKDVNVTGCPLGKEETTNSREDELRNGLDGDEYQEWPENHDVQALARKLYPEDFRLWEKHCR